MAAGGGLKGTVTPLGSLFSSGEALKAARRVEEAIADRRKELDRLHGFVADNSATITLVRQLPDELSHQIMVPFGNAAFFPGRLVHTNEFLVLLGEVYYVERTAKQTAEILQRRGKTLEDQIETLKAVVGDLEAEAKFFDSTAAEAAEGIVEIREEYVEEPQKRGPGVAVAQSNSLGSTPDNSKLLDKDAEYARIMARLDELEKEEGEEDEDEDEEDGEEGEGEEEEEEDEEDGEEGEGEEEEKEEQVEIEEEEKEEEEEQTESASDSEETDDVEGGSGFFTHDNYAKGIESRSLKIEEPKKTAQNSKDQEPFNSAAAKPIGVGSPQQFTEESSSEGLNTQFAPKDGSYKGSMEQSRTKQMVPLPAETSASVSELKNSSGNVVSQPSAMGFDGRRAFTGSIVEHSHVLSPDQSTKSSMLDQPLGSNPAKPVSRFKMQRGNR